MRIPVAAEAASVTGISERGRYSNSSNSIASRTAATGLPNVAAIPAAAPAANSVFRSATVMRMNCPNTDPKAPPVAMIGPSAPKGPPVPIEMAEETGFKNVTRAGIRLSLVRICSIASGMPCPRIAVEPYRAIIPIMSAPMMGMGTDHQPKRGIASAGRSSLSENSPKYARFVMPAIKPSSNCATKAAAIPNRIPKTHINSTRRSIRE